jgi:hypothetical protein
MELNNSADSDDKFGGNFKNFFNLFNKNTVDADSLNSWKFFTSEDLFDSRYQQSMIKKSIFSDLTDHVSNDSNFLYNYFDFSEVDRSVRKSQGTNSGLCLI